MSLPDSAGDTSEDTPLIHMSLNKSAASRREGSDTPANDVNESHVASGIKRIGISLDCWISDFSDRLIPGDVEIVQNQDDPACSKTDKDGVYHGRTKIFDGDNGDVVSSRRRQNILFRRSIQRRIFLILTYPQTSILSFIFFVVLILAIALSNIMMMLQTMPSFQFVPPDCATCGDTQDYYSNNEYVEKYASIPDLVDLPIDCQCPPEPLPWTVFCEDIVIWFFTVEWSLRVICFEPPRCQNKVPNYLSMFKNKVSYLMEWTTIMDALAIFPYFMERYEIANGLLSLRLLQLFRVFQLLRLGQYSTTFVSLLNVLSQALLSMNILLMVLMFGAAFFGSMMYWMEKGEWKYTTYTDPPTFAYMRVAADGVSEEPSPFTSIPASFWWFLVTATTVGYGDTYPTSFSGKCIAVFAMLTGVLVIAFPVSVFSDLWSKELERQGVIILSDSTTDLQDDGAVGNGSREREQELAAREARSAGLTMSEPDLTAIRLHLERIDDSQNEIRRILSVYEE